MALGQRKAVAPKMLDPSPDLTGRWNIFIDRRERNTYAKRGALSFAGLSPERPNSFGPTDRMVARQLRVSKKSRAIVFRIPIVRSGRNCVRRSGLTLAVTGWL
jgi:hypothetical protein